MRGSFSELYCSVSNEGRSTIREIRDVRCQNLRDLLTRNMAVVRSASGSFGDLCFRSDIDGSPVEGACAASNYLLSGGSPEAFVPMY